MVSRTGTRGFRRRAGRGSVLLYAVLAIIALCAVCSLAVDLGRIQLTKTEMSRCADATARVCADLYKQYGSSVASTNGPQFASTAYNPVDGGSGVNPTVAVTWGTWDASANSFTAGGSTGFTAVQVTVSRTAANNNAIPLIWGSIFGQSNFDLQATAIAVLFGGQSTAVNFSAVASPYLAGMPTGTTSGYGDTLSNATPYQVPNVAVTPGTWINVTNASGSTSICPGYVGSYGPGGDTALPLHHGENWNHSPNNPGPENGIADAVMPASALMGVFLDDNDPSLSAAPATVDWTQPSMQNQTSYSNIQLRQPFLIGNGMTSGGVTQQFQVPAGATRMFLGIWDGTQYSNNTGSLSATLSVQTSVQIVR